MTPPPSFPPPLPQPTPPAATAAGTAAPAYDDAAHPGGSSCPDAGPAPVVPRAVTVGFTLMLVRAAFSLIGLIVTFTTRNQLLAQVERRQRLQSQRAGVPSPVDARSIVDAGIAVGVVIGLAVLVFYVFLAFTVRRGRQWARVVTWVFAGIGVLGLLAQFLVSASGTTRAIGVATGLLDIAIIIVLASSSTSRFVTETAAHRRP